ncbi:MAG: tyrosine--tRNA ligase [Planctomycetes bacterium TMED75]|nr:tyrosine--tRNA ligase [Planctomycetaceae bacterium]OUU90653.1 MAG: tyrosine--tRNA ligase [Planctomycetes bacterium TMED75]
MSCFLDELSWRGLLHSTTSNDLAAHLATPGRVAYCGFDPTADALTIGNLMPLKMLAHWQRAGHRPVALMGGATGLIGDPSGKSEERRLLDRGQVEANIANYQATFERMLDFDGVGEHRASIVNNHDWLGSIGYIHMLRDVGKHFSVNMMIQKESVSARLTEREQGISYTEFSYMILQAYDFLHLNRTMNCTVQIGGSDQYGNIVAGIDLIRRLVGREDHVSPDAEGRAYGVTNPLVTRSDGGKIGKSEQGAIWLDPKKTSPYAFYQFWLNTADDDVVKFLKWFTFESQERVGALEEASINAPHAREAQQALAKAMTVMIHGETEFDRASAASRALFSGAVRELDVQMLGEVFADVPSSSHARGSLDGEGLDLVELLTQTTLAGSKREARQFLEQGAVSVNGEKVPLDRRLIASDLLHGSTVLLRRGKKAWHALRFES